MFPCRCDRALGAATSNQVHQRHGHQAGPGAVAEAQLWPLWCHFLVGESAAGAREAAADRAFHEHPRHRSQHQETKGSHRQIIRYIPGALSLYLAASWWLKKKCFCKKRNLFFFSWNKKKIFFSPPNLLFLKRNLIFYKTFFFNSFYFLLPPKLFLYFEYSFFKKKKKFYKNVQFRTRYVHVWKKFERIFFWCVN